MSYGLLPTLVALTVMSTMCAEKRTTTTTTQRNGRTEDAIPMANKEDARREALQENNPKQIECTNRGLWFNPAEEEEGKACTTMPLVQNCDQAKLKAAFPKPTSRDPFQASFSAAMMPNFDEPLREGYEIATCGIQPDPNGGGPKFGVVYFKYDAAQGVRGRQVLTNYGIGSDDDMDLNQGSGPVANGAAPPAVPAPVAPAPVVPATPVPTASTYAALTCKLDAPVYGGSKLFTARGVSLREVKFHNTVQWPFPAGVTGATLDLVETTAYQSSTELKTERSFLLKAVSTTKGSGGKFGGGTTRYGSVEHPYKYEVLSSTMQQAGNQTTFTVIFRDGTEGKVENRLVAVVIDGWIVSLDFKLPVYKETAGGLFSEFRGEYQQVCVKSATSAN